MPTLPAPSSNSTASASPFQNQSRSKRSCCDKVLEPGELSDNAFWNCPLAQCELDLSGRTQRSGPLGCDVLVLGHVAHSSFHLCWFVRVIHFFLAKWLLYPGSKRLLSTRILNSRPSQFWALSRWSEDSDSESPKKQLKADQLADEMWDCHGCNTKRMKFSITSTNWRALATG